MMNFNEAAELLRMKPHVLRFGLYYGLIDIPFERVNGLRVFSRKALAEWLVEKRPKPTNDVLLDEAEQTLSELREFGRLPK